MTNEDSTRYRKGATAPGRLGLAVLLCGLITAPAVSQDARFFRETAASVKDEAGKVRKPPVSGGKVAVQLLAGAAVTAAAFGASLLTASESTLDDDEAMRRRATAWQLVGGAGLTPLVVYLVGNSGAQKGSLGKTYLYGAVGGAAGALLLFLAFESDTEALGYIALTVSTLGPAISAVIGYNAGRRYDPPAPVRSAILNIGQGKLRLGVPAPQIFFSGPGRKSPGLAVRLFQADL